MRQFFKYTLAGFAAVFFLAIMFRSEAKGWAPGDGYSAHDPSPADTDTTKHAAEPLPYPYTDQSGQDPLYFDNNGNLKLHDPDNIKTTVNYDPDSNLYYVDQNIGGLDYRPPSYMTQDEYIDYDMRKSVRDYWRSRSHAESQNQAGNRGLIPPIKINSQVFDRIFGGGTIDIRPQGSAELIFGVNVNRTENPALPERQRRISTFDFDEKIQLNVVGKIGDKLKLTTNYNTEASFDFENQMKLEYTGYEDEIIKKIEAGNVSLPLNGSLITGSQSLFGLKAQLQFGRLTVTSVVSQEKGKKSEVNVQGGAQTNTFEVEGSNYEANKHFFLSQYFYDHYDRALANFPVVNSGVNITRMEVWVTNRSGAVENTRNIAAFADLGERTRETVGSGFILDQAQPGDSLPFNDQNNLYDTLSSSSSVFNGIRDINNVQSVLQPLSAGYNFNLGLSYEKISNARKLAPTEFTFNPRLGYISLNQALNYDEVLAVAYQYTIGNQVYQVGEFSDGGITGQNTLILKLLKGTNLVPKITDPSGNYAHYNLWNLMMKNIYSIGAYQVNPQDFRLEAWYNNQTTGTYINYMPEGVIRGVPLIQVLNLDKLNSQSQASPDGVFDYIEGVTILSSNGRIIFPVREPFGRFLEAKFADPTVSVKYVYKELYDSTKTAAQQVQSKNRFKLKGQYKSSSSSEIALNAVNIPQGSVTVTAGGAPLQENIDYTVDYALGKVKIINEGILNSGVPIKISLESNSLFSIQSKTLFGTHFDYRVNKDFNIGATAMNLTERPLTQKVNIGEEPMSNWIVGLDLNYRTDAPFITRLIDKLPLLSTKEKSSISVLAEAAYLIPGVNKAIGKTGTSYIDDFEGTQSLIDIKSPQGWSLASIPQGQPSLFPEANWHDTLPIGFNRAHLAWYVVDPLFIRSGSNTNSLKPDHITPADQSDHRVREVLETEVFPNKQPPQGQPLNVPMFDLAYYPSERGPYNYDVNQTVYSKGLNNDGSLKNPETRWGGIMRKIETNDFEAANIEFVQFWVMDPYNEDNPVANQNTTGEILLHLGNVSEDVMKDGRNAFENGNPTTTPPTLIDTTAWGRVPILQSVVNAFDNDPAKRILQDVGLDGLSDADERTYFQSYITATSTAFGANSGAAQSASNDPSGDMYHHYRGQDYDDAHTSILERYKLYNGMEGNSVSDEKTDGKGSFTPQSTTLPNQEDINRDNTLNETESYYQYHIKLTPNDINPNNIGHNFITDVYQTTVTTADGRTRPITWYQFKVPVRSFDQKVGNIDGFNSIRFIRMVFRGVDKPVVCRFARLELVRADWRKYLFSLTNPGEYLGNDQGSTSFNVSAVNIEENGNRVPVNYVLPPGIDREQNVQSANLVRLNEQSLSMSVCGLEDGDARAAYKNSNLDVRSYKKLRMFVHAEAAAGGAEPLHDNDLSVFVRLGTDLTDNYYEYEIPLKVTPPGNYGANDDAERKKVWPEENNMELAFTTLQKIKQERNNDIASGLASLTGEYAAPDPDNGLRTVRVKGNPNLSNIKVMLIGIRNPKKVGQGSSDDGLSKCAEVWVNELRLTDFDEKGGWAATTRVTAKLADLGTLNLTGNMATPGFGSVEKKVSERLRETQQSYDISTQLEMGKFFPEKWNIRVPLFWGYGQTRITPQFNPLDPDILLDPYLKDNTIAQSVRDSIANVTVDMTTRRSFNLTNVRKDRGKGASKSHLWDVENLSASFAYTEVSRHNVNLEVSEARNYRGGLTYVYNNTPKSIKPFEKVKALNKKSLAIIRDINFSPLPSMLGFSSDLSRSYSEQKNRNTTGDNDVIIQPFFNKNFQWMRNYDLRWDLTKNLKLEFSADNDSRVLEPEGRIDTDEKKDTVRQHLKGFGENLNYHHNTSINFNLPINKLPGFDWVTASVRYTTTYSWQRAPFAADSVGNTISNTSQWQWTAQGNLTTLYNHVPYFKKINQKTNNKPKNGPAGGKAPTPGGKGPQPAPANKDTTKKDQYEIVEYLARLVMSLRTVNVNYSTNSGLSLPGYRQWSQFMGMDQHFEGPTPGFLFGQQSGFGPDNEPFPIYASQQGWLVQTQSLFTPFTSTYTQNMTARATLEPFPDLRVELNATRTYALNKSEFYRWNGTSQSYVEETPTENGNFSMSFVSWRTAFRKDNKEHVSEVFEQFLNNRATISQRLGEKNTNSSGYAPDGVFRDGYSSTSQDVVIPAFLAAYRGKNAAGTSLGLMPKLPMPNWRVTYDGLSKIESLKKTFKTVTLGHGYRSTYSIGSFQTNLDYQDLDGDGFPDNVRNSANDFQSKYQINSVTIAEQFSPLVNIDMTWQNSLSTKVEYKKDRTMNLSLLNTQLTEISGREIVVGAGYRFKQVPLSFLSKIMKKTPKSDLNLRADVSYRNNQTVIRKAVEDYNQLTAGQNILSIKTSADYVLNEKLNIRLFCDRIVTNPLVSSSFKTANTNAGISLRFTLAQ